MLNQKYSVELKPVQYDYLTAIAKKYRLDDESKALRCLINFALQESEYEAKIFEEIRCMDC